MKGTLWVLVVAIVGLAYAAAQDKQVEPAATVAEVEEAKPAPESAKTQEPAKPEPVKAAEPVKAPEAPKAPEPAKVVEPVKAPEAVKASEIVKAPEPVKARELTPCAKAFVPLAEGYKKAYDDAMRWIQQVDEQTAAADAKVNGLQETVEKNEALITKLKIEDTKESKLRARDLARENKQLWADLSAARKERTAKCAAFSKAAAQLNKEIAAEISARLSAIQAK